MFIQSTNNINSGKLNCIIYGPSGSGKTTQAKKLLEAGYSPLVISFESGLLSLSGSSVDYIDGSKDEKGNPIAKEARMQNLAKIYSYLLTDEVKKKYDTIFIDSLTEVSQCMFDAYRKEYPERKDNMVLFGELAKASVGLIKSFRDIPHYNVVMTCLSKIEKDDNARRFAALDVIGSVSEKIPAFFDEVFYLRTNQDFTREMICHSSDAVAAKDRSGKLQNSEPADLGLIFNKIRKG